MRPPGGTGWFSFVCAKPRTQRSTLLEANLAAKSETVPLCVPCEPGESGLRRVGTSGSLLSEASTAPGIRDVPEVPRRASFADQQQQPLEKMCATNAQCLSRRRPNSPALLPPPRRFYVPSRVDLAAMINEEDDSDDVAMILEKLRRSDEQEDLYNAYEEAKLLVWMRLQQEAARKTWGVKGNATEYRRRQLLRWGQNQRVFDGKKKLEEGNGQQATPPSLPTLMGAISELVTPGAPDSPAQRRRALVAAGMESRKDGEFAEAPPDDGAIARFLDVLRDVLKPRDLLSEESSPSPPSPPLPSSRQALPAFDAFALASAEPLPPAARQLWGVALGGTEPGEPGSPTRARAEDQVDVFVDALDSRVGDAFSQLVSLFRSASPPGSPPRSPPRIRPWDPPAVSSA